MKADPHCAAAVVTDRSHLSDFTDVSRIARMCLLAVPVGGFAAVAAWALVRLIGLITNAVFYHRISGTIVTPDGTQAWWLLLAAPVAGGVIVGLLARYGSAAVGGHGLPEAIEALLIGRATIPARVAVLKPLASGIAIGSGGPFGAEGPIIMTGGAIGSLFGQVNTISVSERRTLLVSGSAAGMATALDAPLAAIVFATELLLFEWRPQSLLPLSTAVCVATLLRPPLLGQHREFLMTGAAGRPLEATWTHELMIAAVCVAVGLLAALLAIALTAMVRGCEHAFARLPVHWMWWPAIGGAVVGLGGMLVPQAMGIGYDVIAHQLNGADDLALTLSILAVKALIWPVALSSGTSGGVLAPAFVIGTCMGGALAGVLPDAGAGFWPLVALAATLSGLLRSPLTGIVFALELTGRWDAVIPVTIASMTACGLSILLLKRSLLSDKVARGGLALNREYRVDPLAATLTSQVMMPLPIQLFGQVTAGDARTALQCDGGCTDRVAHRSDHPHLIARAQRLFPVLNEHDLMIGIVTLSMLSGCHEDETSLASLAQHAPVMIHADSTLSEAAELMALHELTTLPVIAGSPAQPQRNDQSFAVVGVVRLRDLLAPRALIRQEEGTRERLIRVPWRASATVERQTVRERARADED